MARRTRFTALVLALVAAIAAVCLAGSAGAVDRPTSAQGGPARASDGAHVVAIKQVAPRLVDLTIASPALAGRAKVRLLTPDGWRAGAQARHWPTLWLLAGCCGDYTAWSTLTDVASIPALRHTLVVMPEGGNIGWYSNYWNHGAYGPPAWEDFHLREVKPIVEQWYGASQDRVVAGLSMGGFGALSYAARHPGLFRAAASYSGVVHPLYQPGGPQNIASINAGYGVTDTGALWGDPVAQRGIWKAHDPYYLVRRLRPIPVFISCGNGQPGPLDQPGTAFSGFETLFEREARALVPRLRAAGVDVRTDFYGPGTHSWPYWQRELHRSLPILLAVLHRRAAA